MTDARTVIASLRRSHERLRALVGSLDAQAVRGPSYDDEWTIAQVLSHLGSGAEIGRLVLDAAVAGQDAPGQDAFVAVWDTWNARTPDAQAADVLPADLALVEAYEALDDTQLAGLRVALGPMSLDAAGVVRLRLSEHAVHTWDVAVMLDPAATVEATAVDLLIDGLGMIAGFAGKPTDPTRIHVTTTDPDREIALDLGDAVHLGPWDGAERPARLSLPAEAFVRLVYGRLDPAHTPPLAADGVDVDLLRVAFPGF
ncbi:maleylpyruvate isomerase N-terminal domain-containing protein [Frankia sp. AvcI1]|uniref:maleylpyruvate isomerase N-terminal domain-containing protein n=1 Tax=Frankia sp. AvcI1 TaxID=573496 RepID=UPI002117554A|nr:maleylpyruvate isomerase N-terminal domain-containing protein [Frankia sp. AvcI1]